MGFLRLLWASYGTGALDEVDSERVEIAAMFLQEAEQVRTVLLAHEA